jgi:hypothetical protein
MFSSLVDLSEYFRLIVKTVGFSLKCCVNMLADAVEVTLGPKGRAVLIDKKFGAPRVTKVDVTVACDIVLEDKCTDMGTHLVPDVAKHANDKVAGDTSTASCLPAAPCFLTEQRSQGVFRRRNRSAGSMRTVHAPVIELTHPT